MSNILSLRAAVTNEAHVTVDQSAGRRLPWDLLLFLKSILTPVVAVQEWKLILCLQGFIAGRWHRFGVQFLLAVGVYVAVCISTVCLCVSSVCTCIDVCKVKMAQSILCYIYNVTFLRLNDPLDSLVLFWDYKGSIIYSIQGTQGSVYLTHLTTSDDSLHWNQMKKMNHAGGNFPSSVLQTKVYEPKFYVSRYKPLWAVLMEVSQSKVLLAPIKIKCGSFFLCEWLQLLLTYPGCERNPGVTLVEFQI